MPSLKQILTTAALFLGIITHAQETIRFDQGSFDAILHRAAKEQKPVLIYFTGTGCALCVEMEKHVFVQPEVYNLYNTSYIAYESFDDGSKPDSAVKRLRRRYNIAANPSFIVVDKNGDVIHRAISYRNTEEFAKFGREGLGQDNYRSWKQQYDRGDYTAETVAKLLATQEKPTLFVESNYACPAEEILTRYFRSLPTDQYSDPLNWSIIKTYVANPESDVFAWLVNHRDEFIRKYGEQEVVRKIYSVYENAWSGNSSGERFKKLESRLRASADPVVQIVVRMKDAYLKAEQMNRQDSLGWDAFIQKHADFLKKNAYLIAPEKYYYWSRDICENRNASPFALRQANEWMQRLVTGNTEPDYDYFATYARTFFRLGNKPEAIRYQQRAIDLAIAEHADKDEVDDFKKTLSLYRQ